MHIFEEAPDGITYSVDILKIGARHRIPLLWKLAGLRLGERLGTLLPDTIFYPNNPRPNNGNKRKNARTETISAVRSRRQRPMGISRTE